MPIETIFLLFLFIGAIIGTPGPGNLLLVSSGAKFGWRPSLPLIIGISLGALFVHLFLALGLWQIIQLYPPILQIMKIIGFCYILWLAYKILGIKIKSNEEVKALSFFSGLVVQPTNPKNWAMLISAYGQFINLEQNWWIQTMIIAIVAFFWHILSHSFWCFLGAKMAFYFKKNQLSEKIFLGLLAFLMVGVSLWAVFQ